MFKTKKLLIILLSILLVCSITGCSEKKENFEPLSLSVNGTEFLIGQATLQTFIDAGYRVTIDNKFEQDIHGLEMPSMTYDIAAYVSKDENIVGIVSFLNNTKGTIPYEECIVNEYDITYKPLTKFESYDTDNILVDGINLKEMKVEDVKKAFEGKVESFKDFTNPDGSVGVISFELNDTYISVKFDYTTKEVASVETEIFLSYFE